MVLCLLNCITETIQATEGSKYFIRGLNVGQPCFKVRQILSFHMQCSISLQLWN
jgi:hypothetical protein